MTFIYFIILCFTITLGLLKYNQIKHTSLLWIWLYLFTAFVVEIIAYITTALHFTANNGFIFNLALPIYFLTTGLFFHKIYEKLLLKNIYLIVISLSLFLYFFFLISVSQSNINSKFFLMTSWFFVISAILYFIQLIVYPHEGNLLKSPQFYIASAILFLYAFFIIYMSLIPLVLTSLKNLNIDLKILKSVINIISYSIILIGFICPQRKQIYD
jgi:hypothetical protein